MGLASLDAALSGLRASQQSISVISNNVSNATTAGYTRKLLPQYAQSVNGETVGAVSGTVIRNVDLNLERDLWTQVSAVESSSVRASYLSGIEQFNGAPDEEISVAAEIARLRDSFSALSDSPDDEFILAQTVEQAVTAADKINDLADLINTTRNDVQSDIQSTVNRINQLLEQIADLNDKVQDNLNIGRTTADTEDKRDSAIKELSGLIGISFFQRGDGVLVVQTEDGVELADTTARKIEFNALPVSAESYYPDTDIGLYVVDHRFDGVASLSPTAINITERELGGRLGGLVELRDSDLPQASAQLDELAHKLALRFQQQGLTLFTDKSGTVPADTAPDPNAIPPTTVEYIGFASQIRVNQAVMNDNSLLRRGTYGATDEEVQSGSNAVISRVVEYAFGTIDYETAYNTDTTTQVDLLNTGGDDLQTWLGLSSTNYMNGARDVTQYASLADMLLSGGDDVFGNASAIPAVPETDRFTLAFSDPATPANDFTVSVDLRDLSTDPTYAIGAVDPFDGGTIDNAAEQMRAYMNDQITALSPGNPYNASVGIGTSGQLTFSSTSDIAIDAAGTEGISDTAFAFIGLTTSASEASDPYFDISVGTDDPVRITIEPGDTSTELLAKLQAVEGLAVDTTNFALDGILRLRPGNDYDNPDFGGSLKIIAGPFKTSGATYGNPPATSTRTGMDNNVNIASALFGTYSVSGTSISNVSPVVDIQYMSETTLGSGKYVAFRSTNLGPNLGVSTKLTGSTQLIDYAQKMVNYNAQQIIHIENEQSDNESLRDILNTQINNESGVNIDEELSNLIVYQTAFSASARVISAVDDLFKELLNAI